MSESLLGSLGGLLGSLGLGDLSLGSLLDNLLDGRLADLEVKLGGDLAVQAHLDGVQTGGLDGAVELDALALDLDAQLVLDGVGDHGVGHGAEELALVADLGVDEDGLAIDDGLQSLGIGDALSLALLDVVTTLLAA